MRRRRGLSGRATLVVAAAGMGLGLAGRELLGWLRESELWGQVALVTGSSRGLGFLIARELADQGCRLVICARDPRELERARQDLEQHGTEVLAIACDVSDRAQVERMVAEATHRFGQIDVLVNNAGIITVAPIQSMTLQDFEQAMGVMFWGMVYPTLAVLPQMLERGSGRIVNITSIGGKVSVPHLLPYNCAKFAAVGFSEGLRAELAREGISVTTVVPGLMRTGSDLNAWFKGDQTAEFTWFTLSASLPLLSMDAERAARQIVRAARRGEAEPILTLAARGIALLHGLFPGLTTDLLGLANRFLPRQRAEGTTAARGMELRERVGSPLLEFATTLGRRAAERFHQMPPPTSSEAAASSQKSRPVEPRESRTRRRAARADGQ